MPTITYELKVDFALAVSLLSLLYVLIQNRLKLKEEKIKAYEAIYQDVSYILTFPFRQKRYELEGLQYQNEDLEFQEAVRKHINSHWMDQIWGYSKIIPPRIKEEKDKIEYMANVRDEASKFEYSLISKSVGLNLAERSPIFHLEDEEINKLLKKVIEYVGKNLYKFSRSIRRNWEDAKFKDPETIKREYDKALEICPTFFEHNPRDFDDPFYDLLEGIRQEYRHLTRSKLTSLRWFFERLWYKLK
jgi:hypothetical protein